MHVYLYDTFVRRRAHAHTLAAIENRLTDFEMGGTIVRLMDLNNPKPIIEEQIRRGAHTAVIVGDDTTLGKIIGHAADCSVVYGYIPVGPEHTIADTLGIPDGEQACEILAARRVEEIDVGQVNNRYFLSGVYIGREKMRLEFDGDFELTGEEGKMEIVIGNLRKPSWGGNTELVQFRPQDGKLEAFVRTVYSEGLFGTRYSDTTILPFERLVIHSFRPVEVRADAYSLKEKNVVVSLSRKRIRVVVGKERKF